MRRIRNKFGKVDLQFICAMQRDICSYENDIKDIYLTIRNNSHEILDRGSKVKCVICEKINDIKKENEELKQIINQQKQ